MRTLFNSDVPASISGKSDRVFLHIFTSNSEDAESLTRSTSGDLNIEITHPEDPLFLKLIHITSFIFNQIKAEQGLLVEFTSFPQKFIDLLHLCAKNEHQASPKFVLRIDNDKNTFNIIETNPFKHLIHLSLSFKPASDNEIKEYIAGRLKIAKNDLNQVSKSFSELQVAHKIAVDNLTCELESINYKLKESQAHSDSIEAELNTKFNSELSLQRATFLQEKDALIEENKKHIHDLETAHTVIVRKLEKTVKEASDVSETASERRHRLESNIREWQSKVSSLQQERDRLQTSLNSSTRDNDSLRNEKHQLEKENERLKARLENMQEQLKDKHDMVLRTTDLVNSEKHQNSLLSAELDSLKLQYQNAHLTANSNAEQVSKANETVNTLHKQLKATREKLSVAGKIAKEQDKLIEDKTSQLCDVNVNLEEMKKRLDRISEEKSEAEARLSVSEQKIIDLEALVKSNEGVISWLNKQINEKGGITPPKSFIPTPLQPSNSRNMGLDERFFKPSKQSTPNSVHGRASPSSNSNPGPSAYFPR